MIYIKGEIDNITPVLESQSGYPYILVDIGERDKNGRLNIVSVKVSNDFDKSQYKKGDKIVDVPIECSAYQKGRKTYIGYSFFKEEKKCDKSSFKSRDEYVEEIESLIKKIKELEKKESKSEDIDKKFKKEESKSENKSSDADKKTEEEPKSEDWVPTKDQGWLKRKVAALAN